MEQSLSGLGRNPHALLFLDGGSATELEKHKDVDLSQSALWSAALLLDRNRQLHDVIRNVHVAYYEVGADIATTVSYQATFDGFLREEPGISDDKAVEYLNRSVDLAADARRLAWPRIQQQEERQLVPPARRRTGLLVAASIGCYGASLADGSEYRGEYGKSKEELMAWHRRRLQVLASHPQVDLLLLETIPCLVEADALLTLLRELEGDNKKKAMLSVSCRNGEQLNSGEPIRDLSTLLKASGIGDQLVAVGVNCTAPQHIASLLQALQVPHAHCVKLAYPNSGEEWDDVQKKWLPAKHGEEGNQWSRWLPLWYDAGARVLGGCCRTGPRDVEAMRSFFSQQDRVLRQQSAPSSDADDT